MNTHVVMRPIQSGTDTLAPGTEVDASKWRNASLLVSQRRLKPIEVKTANEPDGRYNADVKGKQHGLQPRNQR